MFLFDSFSKIFLGSTSFGSSFFVSLNPMSCIGFVELVGLIAREITNTIQATFYISLFSFKFD